MASRAIRKTPRTSRTYYCSPSHLPCTLSSWRVAPQHVSSALIKAGYDDREGPRSPKASSRPSAMRSQVPGFHQHLLLSKPRSPRRGIPFHCPTTSRGCRGNAGRAHGCTARVPHTCAVASPQTQIVISRCCQPIRILERGLVACTNSAPVTIPPGLILCPTGWTRGCRRSPAFFAAVDDLEICGRRFARARSLIAKRTNCEGELSPALGWDNDATGREVQKHSR